MKFIFLVIFVLPLMSACGKVNICYDNFGLCKPSAGPRPPGPKFVVVPLGEEEKKCSCEGATQFAIQNNGIAGRASWLTVSREPENQTPKTATSTQNINAGGRVLLNCSIEPTEKKQCQRSVVTVFDGQTYGGDVDKIMNGIVVSTAKADLENMKELPAAIGNCPAKCKSGPDCIQIDAKESQSVGVGRSIALQFGKQNSVVENKYIVQQTSSKTNVCQRSDIVFEAGTGYNVGLSEGCEIQVSAPTPFDSMQISIPRTVSFKHLLKEGSNFDISFYRREAAPELTFSNPNIQNAYGGRILLATYDAGNFVFEMEKGHRCFAARVN